MWRAGEFESNVEEVCSSDDDDDLLGAREPKINRNCILLFVWRCEKRFGFFLPSNCRRLCASAHIKCMHTRNWQHATTSKPISSEIHCYSLPCLHRYCLYEPAAIWGCGQATVPYETKSHLCRLVAARHGVVSFSVMRTKVFLRVWKALIFIWRLCHSVGSKWEKQMIHKWRMTRSEPAIERIRILQKFCWACNLIYLRTVGRVPFCPNGWDKIWLICTWMLSNDGWLCIRADSANEYSLDFPNFVVGLVAMLAGRRMAHVNSQLK